MTKQLSPAAEAVLDAAVDAYGINYSEFHCCADRVTAAALRAAAEECAGLPDGSDCTNLLIEIANELEAQ